MSWRAGSTGATPAKMAYSAVPQDYGLPRSAPGSSVKASPAGGIFKSAAVQVLCRERRLMTTGEICRLALEWGLLNCQGKTPEATMASSMYGDIKRKDRRSTFIRPQEGLFGLREWVKEGYLPAMPEHSTPMPNKRSHKASRRPTQRKRSRRGRYNDDDEEGVDSDYFTTEDEGDSILSCDLSSDSDAQQRPRKRGGTGRPRGRPRRNPPPGDVAQSGQAAGAGGALRLLGELACSPPIRKMLSYGSQAFAQVQQAFAGAALQAWGGRGPEPFAQEGGDLTDFCQGLPPLELGPVVPSGKDPALSPPLHAALQSPALPGDCLPLLPDGLGAGSIFSPAAALSLPGAGAGSGRGSFCSPAPLCSSAAALGLGPSPDILSLQLPPGAPAMALPLPRAPPAPVPSASASLPSSAIKATSASCSLSGALMRCDSGWPSASKAGCGPSEPSIMVLLNSGGTVSTLGPAAVHAAGLAAPQLQPQPEQPGIGCGGVAAGEPSLPWSLHALSLAANGAVVSALMAPPPAPEQSSGQLQMPGGGSAAIETYLPCPSSSDVAAAAPPAAAAAAAAAGAAVVAALDPAMVNTVAALVAKIAELEAKVSGVEAKFGPLHTQTGRAFLLLHHACRHEQVAPWFSGKAAAALQRACQIMHHNGQDTSNLAAPTLADYACLMQGPCREPAAGGAQW